MKADDYLRKHGREDSEETRRLKAELEARPALDALQGAIVPKPDSPITAAKEANSHQLHRFKST